MAASELSDSAAANKAEVLDGRRGELLASYLSWLEGRLLAARGRQV